MKKLYFLIFLTITIGGVFTKVNAQSSDKVSLSFGPEFGIPLNTYLNPNNINYNVARDYYKDGIGGSLKLELPVITGLRVTFSAGYMYYNAAEREFLYFDGPGIVEVTTPAYTYIPIKAGLRFYPSKYFYIESEAGEAIKTSSSATSAFIYTGGVGGIFPINAHNSIDLGARIEKGYKNLDFTYPMEQVAIRLAYRYNF